MKQIIVLPTLEHGYSANTAKQVEHLHEVLSKEFGKELLNLAWILAHESADATTRGAYLFNLLGRSKKEHIFPFKELTKLVDILNQISNFTKATDAICFLPQSMFTEFSYSWKTGELGIGGRAKASAQEVPSLNRRALGLCFDVRTNRATILKEATV